MTQKYFYLALCLFVACVYGIQPLISYDLWWHIATGSWIIEHNHVPQFDPFSYTAYGKPWMGHEWGASLIFCAIFVLGGVNGLIFLKAMGVFLIVFFLAKTTHLITKNKFDVVWVILAFPFLGLERLVARPHLFGLIFLSLLFYLLYFSWSQPKNKLRILYPVPILFLLWANIHGSVLLGLATLGLFWAGSVFESYRQSQKNWHWPLVIILIASALIILINPFFYKIYTFPIEHWNLSKIIAGTQEWQPPWKSPWLTHYPFQAYFVLLGAVLWTVVVRFKKVRFEFLLVGLVFVYLSINANRYTANFAIWALPVLISLLNPTDFLDRFKILQKWSLQKILLALLVLTNLSFIWLGIPVSFGKKTYVGLGTYSNSIPHEAVAYLKNNNITDKVFNEFGFGSYLILAKIPVFIDGRAPIYGDEFFQTYTASLQHPKVFDQLQKQWNFKVVLLSQEFKKLNHVLHNYLATSADWYQAHSDDTAVVYRLRE